MRKSHPIPSAVAIALALGVCSAAASAQSALPTGVGIYLTNDTVGIGSASYASSSTVTIYSGGGLDVSTPTNGDTYALTSSNTMPLNLTKGTLSTIGSDIPRGHATGTASATADLAGGVVRGSTGSSADVPFHPVGPVASRNATTSLIQDYVTFATGSAGGSDVTVTAHLDGSYALSDPNYAGGNVTVALSFGGSFSYYGVDNAGGYTYADHGAVIGDFTSYDFTNETPSGFDFTGQLHVTDGERLRMTFALYVDCSSASCDFGNTGRIGLTVPTGVTYTSDSGVFLTDTGTGTGTGGVTTAVPEPESWALMLGGLAAIGSVTRRRLAGRRAAA